MGEHIDEAWLREHGGRQFVGHIRMEGESRSAYRCVDLRDGQPIGLDFTDTTYNRNKRNGPDAGRTVRTWFVGDLYAGLVLAEALDCLNAMRAEAA